MYWKVMVIAPCLLLLLLLIWKEARRANKSRLAIRIIASAFAVISLACLAVPITIMQKQRTNNAALIMLLTEGFNNDSAQKIFKAGNEARIFTLKKNIRAFDAMYITDITLLKEYAENAAAIHIFGYGLNEHGLNALKDVPVLFHTAAVTNKITSIGWKQKLTPGEPLIVQGSFNNTTSSQVKISLTGFNTGLDSITLTANQTSYFQLSSAIKHIGKAVYTVTVLSGKDTLEHEPVPVEVKIAQPLNILLLAASPDFENKFLKNWLTENEYKFTVRTRISKDKYYKEYVNMPVVSCDDISPSLLEKFDVIIADAAELYKLPASGMATIKSYVDSKGLGLIVKADSAYNSSVFYLKSFPLVEINDSLQHSLTLTLREDTTSPLKIEQPVYIRHVAGTQMLVKDQLMRTVVNSKIYGSGKVVLTTIPNTYTWRLSGNNSDYTSYWSWILGKAANKNMLQQVWAVTPMLPQKNETIEVKLQTAKTTIPQVKVGGDKVYMEQNFYLPYEWAGNYWPKITGWQPLTEDEGMPYWWYVYDTEDWKGIKALDNIQATKKYTKDHPYKLPDTSLSSATIIIEIPAIYFFIPFLICAGFLWFEKKFKGG